MRLFLFLIGLRLVLGCKIEMPDLFLEYIHYEQNQQRNIIFIHGSFATATQLFPFADDYRIKRLANSFLVTMPNHGNSYDDPNFSLDSITADIARFIKKRHLKSVYLVGHSLGALVAMNLAAKHGSLISGVLSLDFLPFGLAPDFFKPFLEILDKFKAIHLNQTIAQIQQDLFSIFSDNQTMQLIASGFEGTEGNYTWSTNIEYYINNVDKLLKDSVPKIPFYGKFKVVLGKQSLVYDRESVNRLSDYYPKIRPETDVIFVDSGHIVYGQFFEECIQALIDLLE